MKRHHREPQPDSQKTQTERAGGERDPADLALVLLAATLPLDEQLALIGNGRSDQVIDRAQRVEPGA